MKINDRMKAQAYSGNAADNCKSCGNNLAGSIPFLSLMLVKICLPCLKETVKFMENK